MLRTRLRTILFFCLIFHPLAEARCYRPDGEPVPSPGSREYVPCNQIAGTISMCCGSNRTNPSGGRAENGGTADICLPNGLCQNIVNNNGEMEYSYWRDSCSSPDFQSAGCLNVCVGVVDQNDARNAPMTPCGSVSNNTGWCCGRNNTNCCFDGTAIKLALTLGASSSTATPSLPTTTPTNATATAPSTPTTTPKNLSAGAKAGIAIGAAIGGLCLLGLGFFLSSWRRRERTMTKSAFVESPANLATNWAGTRLYGGGTPSNVRHELDYNPQRAELM